MSAKKRKNKLTGTLRGTLRGTNRPKNKIIDGALMTKKHAEMAEKTV